ncbi:MAG: AsmA-like C-terminal region-containing protein [Dinoroseobacter sp.]|nr:AsmA-like C-terminal region-containing protein [Dinoroseobacter sp.]
MPVVLVLLSWLLLYSAAFNGLRSSLLERSLTEEIGQAVVINGTVRVRLGATLIVEVTDAVIPSSELPEQPLSELEHLSLQANLMEAIRGDRDFYGLIVRGLSVNLIQQEDGRNTWSTPATSAEDKAPAIETDRAVGAVASDAVAQFFEAKTLLSFVLERSQSASAVRVLIDDQKSGFVFDYALDEMTFERPRGREEVRISSTGNVNGQPFSSSSQYSVEGPFSTNIDIGALSLEFAGVNHPVSEGGGYTSQLSLTTTSIGELLEILRLERTLEGEGAFHADISERNGIVAVEDIELLLDFDSERSFAVSGNIRDFKTLGDVDIALDLQLVPDPDSLPPAESVSDVQFAEVTARLEGRGGEIKVEDAVVRTNAFNKGIDEFGPVSIGRMRRTTDSRLELLDMSLQAGPIDAPYVLATGQILDAMQLESYAFEGRVDLPAELVLGDFDQEAAAEFGKVAGRFGLDDSAGFPRLRYFDLRTEDTELWSMRATAESSSDENAQNVTLDLVLDVAGDGLFFEALDLPPINLSPFGVDIGAKFDGSLLETAAGFRAGDSDLTVDLALDSPSRNWRLLGDIKSSTLLMRDLEKLLDGLEALSSVSNGTSGTDASNSAEKNQVPVQPLMLPEEGETTRSLEALLAEEGVQPLIVARLDEPKLADLFDPEIVLRYMDVEVGIAIARLSGLKGVTAINSALTAKDGQAQLAPIRFTYGNGSVDAQATMNMVDAPDVVRLSGSAGGWDLGDVLTVFDASLEASGVLSGNFDVSGRYKNAETFLDTMRGRATVRMSDGMIATSLLELAGLGIFPWLFTQERRERRTTIACLAAPVRVDAGTILSDQAVLETNQVQLVTSGSVSWRNDTIALRAEARPIGRPLARSAWPFEVSGKLSSPDFNLQAGGSRVRREDGANVMPQNRIPCVPDIAQLQGN